MCIKYQLRIWQLNLTTHKSFQLSVEITLKFFNPPMIFLKQISSQNFSKFKIFLLFILGYYNVSGTPNQYFLWEMTKVKNNTI